MANSLLLLYLVGTAGWPLLAFSLCPYHFRLGYQWTLCRVLFVFGLAGVAAIGLGDNMVSLERAGQSSAPLFFIRCMGFAFPFVVLALWLAIHSIRRFRRERATPTI